VESANQKCAHREIPIILVEFSDGHIKARLAWKKFVSPEDCLKDYETWAAALGKDR